MRQYDTHLEKTRKSPLAVARLQAGRSSRTSLQANSQTPGSPPLSRRYRGASIVVHRRCVLAAGRCHHRLALENKMIWCGLLVKYPARRVAVCWHGDPLVLVHLNRWKHPSAFHDSTRPIHQFKAWFWLLPQYPIIRSTGGMHCRACLLLI